MHDDRGGTAILEVSSNGTSHAEVREKFLKIDPPPFELDDLVDRARAQLERRFTAAEGPGAPDVDRGPEIEKARREADRAALDAQEAHATSRGVNDALEAAQAARDALGQAMEAVRRAESDARSDDDGRRGELAVAARDAANSAEEARGHLARARAEAEQSDLDDVAASLRTPQTETTRLAGVLREIATAAESFDADAEGDNGSARRRRTNVPSRLSGVLERAPRAIEPLDRAVDAMSDAVRERRAAAAGADQDAERARSRVAELEASSVPTDDEADHGPFESPSKELLEYVARKGLRSSLHQLTQLINRNSLGEVERLLLSTPGVYEWALLRLLKEQKSPATDTKGLRLAVVAEINAEPRTYFLDQLLDAYRDERDLDIGREQRRRLRARLLSDDGARFVRLSTGRTAKALDVLIEEERREGDLPQYVQQFARKGEIDPLRFTHDVRAAMVDYLEDLGLKRLTPQKVSAGDYDEYFVQAYNYAVFGDGRRRPAKLRPVRPSDTDFLMDTFPLAEEQGVVREHILAAAALYQMYVLGDQLGIFAMPTALMLRRARGRLDLSRSTGSEQLQEYKRYLRIAPLLPEDRQLLYRRVFSEGAGEVLEDAIANEDFPQLWDALMSEIAQYIHKTEENSSDLEDKISRGPVDEAVRNLQYNLSFFATDIAEDVRDMKQQYDLALSVLQNPDIISAVVTGPRQNMWTVIERVIADDIKRAPNVSAMRRLGVEGYKILRYVADFEGPVSEQDFKDFIRSGEIWIIAQGALGPVRPTDEADDEDEFAESDIAEDDDWES